MQLQARAWSPLAFPSASARPKKTPLPRPGPSAPSSFVLRVWGHAALRFASAAPRLSPPGGGGRGGTWPWRSGGACAAAAAGAPPPPVPMYLDFKALLSPLEEAVALLAAASLAAALMCQLKMALLPSAAAFAFALFLLRGVLAEAKEQAVLITEEEAAYPNSSWVTVDGVGVHTTQCAAPLGLGGGWAAVCVHGFGANTYSWEPVLAAIAARLGAVAWALDMPGFGLTKRPRGISKYSSFFAARAASECLKLAASDGGGKEAGGGRRRVLIGHSLGGLAATRAAIQCCERVDALVLVAPAIVASGDPPPMQGEAGGMGGGGYAEKRRRRGIPPRLLTAAVRLAKGTVGRALDLAIVILTPALLPLLRQIVRSRGFWAAGLRGARHNGGTLTDDMVDGYRRPKVVRGWERGLLRFVRGRLAEGWTPAQIETRLPLDPNFPLAEALGDAQDIPLLIIHGQEDIIIPVENSRRLAAMSPRARLVVVPGCGHIPHEEKPEEFVEAVRGFLDGL